MSNQNKLFVAPVALALFTLFSGCSKQEQPAPAPAQPAQAAVPQVGGEPVVKITRPATSNGQGMEFLSATVLPGRGMSVFQITANVPGKGEIPIFASPTLEEAAAKLNGGPDDDNGNESFLNNGAPFLVPYPNRIVGPVSSDGKTVTTKWHGKTITLPANWHSSADPTKDKHAMHGLILASQTQDVATQNIPDGQTITGVIHAGDFGGHWLSQTDLSFVISLTGPALDCTIVAKNVGKDPEPMAIGWHPYFAIPSGDRKQALLHVPATKVAAINNYQDVFPTGELMGVKGTKYDFTAPNGKALDDIMLDDNWSNLQRTKGAVDVSLADPAANYGVHVLGLSPEIRTIQVYAPPAKAFAAIEEQFNFGDPFGKEWGSMNTGMVTLDPGKSVEWHVRLTLFQPGK